MEAKIVNPAYYVKLMCFQPICRPHGQYTIHNGIANQIQSRRNNLSPPLVDTVLFGLSLSGFPSKFLNASARERLPHPYKECFVLLPNRCGILHSRYQHIYKILCTLLVASSESSVQHFKQSATNSAEQLWK